MMQNKSIQKSSNKIRSYKSLKKKLRMMIVNKSLYGFLTILTPFRNLVNVTLQECRVNFLSNEFSTLHHLQELKLFSKNFVVNTTQSAWEQLEQAAVIRSNLELLEIRNNNLPVSSLQIAYTDNFTKLVINWNRIDSSPKEFGSLPLLSLDLSYNNLGGSEQFTWEWLMQAPIRNNLQKLDISHNYFTEIPIQINCMKNLQILNLGENKIKFLPKEFGILSQLMKLDLSENFLGRSENSTWEWLENSIRDNLSELDIGRNFLTEFPLQITYMTNLQSLDISENKIQFLPKELGTLPHLMILNLTSNHLGKSDDNHKWEWLEQAAIRNKLSELHLCENLLTELPPQIGKLSALNILNLVGNELECLPQTIANLQNLKDLNLCGNNLLYLPGNMAKLSISIDVDENPFNLKDDNDNLTTEVPSLMECSAEVIVKSGLKTFIDCAKFPNVLFRYLENEENYCSFCGSPCFFYYGKRFIQYSEYDEVMGIEMDGTSNILNASFECYACSSKCATLLWK